MVVETHGGLKRLPSNSPVSDPPLPGLAGDGKSSARAARSRVVGVVDVGPLQFMSCRIALAPRGLAAGIDCMIPTPLFGDFHIRLICPARFCISCVVLPEHQSPFRNTTTLVAAGVYRLIRQFLHASLLALVWCACLKNPFASSGIVLALSASGFLIATSVVRQSVVSERVAKPDTPQGLNLIETSPACSPELSGRIRPWGFLYTCSGAVRDRCGRFSSGGVR